MINGKTNLVGVLGHPVTHSLSPVMHNAALKEMGLNWCYLALPCEANHLSTILESLYAMNCQGLNITIPYKQDVAKMCTKLSPTAQRLGAVNTLIRNDQAGWTGTNTDLIGFIAGLGSTHWQGKNAIVLGCGGSAKAVGSLVGKRRSNWLIHFYELVISLFQTSINCS